MMMLWLACLLIGSITCTPLKKAGTMSAAQPGSNWRSGGAAGGYGGAAGGSGGYGGAAGGYGSAAGGYGGRISYGSANQDEASSSGSATGDVAPASIFSDVSYLEPVYYYSSRSRYAQERDAFAQTRYTPGDFYPVAAAPSDAEQTSRLSNPAKGGF